MELNFSRTALNHCVNGRSRYLTSVYCRNGYRVIDCMYCLRSVWIETWFYFFVIFRIHRFWSQCRQETARAVSLCGWARRWTEASCFVAPNMGRSISSRSCCFPCVSSSLPSFTGPHTLVRRIALQLRGLSEQYSLSERTLARVLTSPSLWL